MKALMKAGFLVASMGLVVSAWACESAGKNTHIGEVQEINSENKTFTIVDAETQQPITFSASKRILDFVAQKQQVIVEYHKDDKGLLALKVQ